MPLIKSHSSRTNCNVISGFQCSGKHFARLSESIAHITASYVIPSVIFSLHLGTMTRVPQLLTTLHRYGTKHWYLGVNEVNVLDKVDRMKFRLLWTGWIIIVVIVVI